MHEKGSHYFPIQPRFGNVDFYIFVFIYLCFFFFFLGGGLLHTPQTQVIHQLVENRQQVFSLPLGGGGSTGLAPDPLQEVVVGVLPNLRKKYTSKPAIKLSILYNTSPGPFRLLL